MVYLRIQPLPFEEMEKMERMLKALTKTEAIVQGWHKDPEAEKEKKVVPHGSLKTLKGKHRCYHDGKWGDREHPDSIPTPNVLFGIAYVTLEDEDWLDRAVEELNGTCFENFVIDVQKVTEDPCNICLQF